MRDFPLVSVIVKLCESTGRAGGLPVFIKQSLAQEAALQKSTEKNSRAKQEVAPKAVATTSIAPTAAVVEQAKTTSTTPAVVVGSTQKHEMQIKLAPDEGAEIKMEMKKGTKALFEWASEGSAVNFVVHGELYNAPKDFFHRYKKGRQVTSDKGVLEAAFDGKHSWFWRNRDKQPVTIKLITQGDYLTIKRVS